MVEKVTYKLIDENISVVQKTVLLETSRIQKKVLEHQEKEVTHWPLLICKKIGLPDSVNGILQWQSSNMYSLSFLESDDINISNNNNDYTGNNNSEY